MQRLGYVYLFRKDTINWLFDFVEVEVMFSDLLEPSPSLVKTAMGFKYLN